ncbi:DMT family transporter [Paenibacillus sp. 481]|uniref:DMT family transporter n=1 Tax=Paenibacillus sp. 481 TaxID=2835869 RepID=UPI001E502205|nr:DMT family transporter [Paenibacillus sp. 481]UHA72276.1 DMT family transporter [Paenibacillus sp. 481]
MSKKSFWQGAICCLFAAVAWGAMFPIAEGALHYIDPFWFSGIRYAAVAILLAAILWWKEGRSAFRAEGHGFKLWMLGTLAFTIYNFGVFWGQQQLGKPGVLLASIMESFMPMLAVLFVWIATRKRPSLITIGCVVVAFIGVLFVVTKGDFSALSSGNMKFIPLLSVFVGVAAWVLFTIGSEQFTGWSALRFSTLTSIYGGLTSIIVAAAMTATGIVDMPTISTLTIILPAMTFMVIVAGLMALLSWIHGIQLLQPINGMLFINFVPATTFVISVMQGYQVSGAEMIGTLLIIGALIVNNIISRRSASMPQTAQTPEADSSTRAAANKNRVSPNRSRKTATTST